MNHTPSAAARSGFEASAENTRKLVFAGVFAALTYIVFTFLSIPIPTIGGGKVTVHLGNAFVALGALLIGSFYGGIGGAIGLTVADLMDPVYLVQAPVTFLVKLALGALVGFIAHRLGHITREHDRARVLHWVTFAVMAGMLFNALVDPAARYFYQILVLGKPAAQVSFAINFGVTLINSVVSTFTAVILYMAARIPLKKAGLFFTF